MMPRKNFNTLRAKMDPELLAEADAQAKEMLAEMLLAELRKQTGYTQEELAKKLGVKQSSLSKLESQANMQINTLQCFIEALGGHLELIAHMPSGDIQITQFNSKAG
jgi:DNA-binding XRE family transcriptional regulator